VAPVDLQALRSRLEATFLGRCVTSFVEMQAFDRSMVIASQAFTALIPLLILVSAVLPAANATLVSDSIIRRFGLTGDSAQAVEVVFAHSDTGSIGVLSLLLLFYSGVSLTRRLQRMYLTAWQLSPLPGVRGPINAALGLGALLIEVSLLYLVRTLVRMLPFDWVFAVPVSVGASLLLWTSIPWLLLDRRVAWRRLLPAGLLTGTCSSLYGVATSIYMPRLMETYSDRYGLFGVTVALVGWLLCISFIVVAATVVAAEFDRSPQPWARAVRRRLGIRDTETNVSTDGGVVMAPAATRARPGRPGEED
jgi:membrane protein